MATASLALVSDGFTELSRGVHSGKSPRLLTRSHVAWAENTTFRGDLPRPRPGWRRLGVNIVSIQGKFQGATVHQPLSGDAHILMVVEGHIYAVDVLPFTKGAHDVSVSGDLNSPLADKVYFANTPGFTVIQDGLARPIIYNGSTCRRSSEAQREVPFGNVMAYGNGRLWVALPDRRSFVASDLIYGPTGTPANSYRDAVLRFTENDIIAEGGAFGVPFEAGPITAMEFMAVQDSSTGQGPLLVGTQRSTFSVSVPFDRTTWKDLTSPVQTILLPNGGPVGPRTLAAVNGDIWYRDPRGIRSIQSAYRDFGQWTNTPLSRPVNRALKYDDDMLLEHGSAVEFDNRLLMTVGPQWDKDIGVYHLGLVALDFDQISDTEGIGATGTPVWEGLWTGMTLMQLIVGEFNGIRRCFAIAYSDDEASYVIWELTKDAKWDDDDVPIRMVIETPEYHFDSPGQRKEIHALRYWLRDLSGSTEVVLKYAPDGFPVWQDWETRNLCATVTNCFTSCQLTPLLAQPRNPILLAVPPPACATGRDTPLNIGYTFAIRVELTGQATLAQMRVDAQPKPEDRPAPCPAAETCTMIESCGENPYEYVFAL